MGDVGAKVRHVLRERAAHDAVTYCDAELRGLKCGLPVGHEGKHQPAHDCHWPGCGKRVAPALWGCRVHWYRLPETLRNRIWRAYRPGQEITKRPSAEYIAASLAVQDWIADALASGAETGGGNGGQ